MTQVIDDDSGYILPATNELDSCSNPSSHFSSIQSEKQLEIIFEVSDIIIDCRRRIQWKKQKKQKRNQSYPYYGQYT